MKNVLMLVFFCIHSLGLTAQSESKPQYGMVSYERILNYNGTPSTRIFNLIFDSVASVFYPVDVPVGDEGTFKATSDDELDFSFEMRLGGNKYIVLTDLNRGIIQSQEGLLKDGKRKTYIVEEEIIGIKWRVEDEFKMINELKAQMATGEFRGRKYTVWFCAQIPVRYGPWKLNGLPGLILGVVDDRNQVIFNAKAIKFPLDSGAVDTTEFQFEDDAVKISLAEYVKVQARQPEEFQKLISSKLPRGAKMEITGNVSTNAIELEYEGEAAH